jgi:hypothetical protein
MSDAGDDAADAADAALRPAHGGRILLELERADAREVRYALSLATAESVSRGTLVLDPSTGAVALECAGAPSWLAEHARRFGAVLVRDHRGVGAPPWPRRVLRWRPAPAVGD